MIEFQYFTSDKAYEEYDDGTLLKNILYFSGAKGIDQIQAMRMAHNLREAAITEASNRKLEGEDGMNKIGVVIVQDRSSPRAHYDEESGCWSAMWRGAATYVEKRVEQVK